MTKLSYLYKLIDCYLLTSKMSEKNEDQPLQVKVNDYTPADKERFGREAISPIHTENGISMAGLNEGHSTDRDFQMSAVAL